MQCLGNLGKACERFCGTGPAASSSALKDQDCYAACPSPLHQVPESRAAPVCETPKLADMVGVGDTWADGGEEPAAEPVREAIVEPPMQPASGLAAQPVEACTPPPTAPPVVLELEPPSAVGLTIPYVAVEAEPETMIEPDPPVTTPKISNVAPPAVVSPGTPMAGCRGASPTEPPTESPAVPLSEPPLVESLTGPVMEPGSESSTEPPRTTGMEGDILTSDDVLATSSLPAVESHTEPPVSKLAACTEAVPFFSGSWPGTRNDWNGDVGVSFVAKAKCRITALGRHADVALSEAVQVTLWTAETQEALAVADVGPGSQVEGGYAFEALGSEVELQAGREYRLTQRCRGRMPDKWFDGRATAEEVTAQTALQFVKFVGGVCRNSFGFPSREDGEYRRAGIVNFKVMQDVLDIVAVTRAELAQQVARAAVAEVPEDPCCLDTYLSVVAGLLALIADELAVLPSAPAAVVIAEEEALKGIVQLEGAVLASEAAVPEDAAPGPPAAAGLSDKGAASGEGVASAIARSVFEHRFAEELVDAARGRRGGCVGEPGSPLEGAFVVSRGGRVLAAEARVLRGSRPVSGAELVAMLGAGMVFSRSAAGSITALLAPEVGQGRALLVKPDGPEEGAARMGLSKV